MAKQSTAGAKAAKAVKAVLSRVAAKNPKLDAECTTALHCSEISDVYHALQPAFELGDSLTHRKALKLDEALVYASNTRLCELLLSVIRRLPWAEMRRVHALAQQGLAVLPSLLSTVGTFLSTMACVRSSQQAAALAELSKRCWPQARARTRLRHEAAQP